MSQEGDMDCEARRSKDDDYFLAPGWTVGELREVIENGIAEENNRKKIAEFIYKRFYCRYLRSIDIESGDYKSGFVMMAISCLMIEELYSFIKGTDRSEGKAFVNFFKRYKNIFQEFDNDVDVKGDEFHRNIRCGILHQGEVKGGWRIHRNKKFPEGEYGKAVSKKYKYELKKYTSVDFEKRIIHANIFIKN